MSRHVVQWGHLGEKNYQIHLLSLIIYNTTGAGGVMVYTSYIMTFFLVKYLAKGAGTEAKIALASVVSSKEKGPTHCSQKNKLCVNLLHDWEGNTGEYSVRGWQYWPDHREGQYIIVR